MIVEYIGPHIDGVAIPYGLGEIEVPFGTPTEVPDDLAAGLLDQPSNWREVPAEPAEGRKDVMADES